MIGVGALGQYAIGQYNPPGLSPYIAQTPGLQPLGVFALGQGSNINSGSQFSQTIEAVLATVVGTTRAATKLVAVSCLTHLCWILPWLRRYRGTASWNAQAGASATWAKEQSDSADWRKGNC